MRWLPAPSHPSRPRRSRRKIEPILSCFLRHHVRGCLRGCTLLSIAKVRDARILIIVISAKAGIQRLLDKIGYPLKLALECLNRGRDDANRSEGVNAFDNPQ